MTKLGPNNDKRDLWYGRTMSKHKRAFRLAEKFPKLPRDPDGYWLCRGCGKRINKGQHYRGWCNGGQCVRKALTLCHACHVNRHTAAKPVAVASLPLFKDAK